MQVFIGGLGWVQATGGFEQHPQYLSVIVNVLVAFVTAGAGGSSVWMKNFFIIAYWLNR